MTGRHDQAVAEAARKLKKFHSVCAYWTANCDSPIRPSITRMWAERERALDKALARAERLAAGASQ